MLINDADFGYIKGQFATNEDQPPLTVLCQRVGLSKEIALRIRNTLAKNRIFLIDSPSIRFGQACVVEVYYKITHTVRDPYLRDAVFDEFEKIYPSIYQQAFLDARTHDTMFQRFETESAFMGIIEVWHKAENEMIAIGREIIQTFNK